MERKNKDLRNDLSRAAYTGQKVRAKMSRADRAKQFMPFSAVGGLDEALEKKLEEHRRLHSGLYYQNETEE